jgi:type IV pilus assembly protein PilA
MLARIRKAQEENEGFTLIELLVVIIIIGILAAIAIPVFLNQRQKGYDAQAKSDARNIATLEETYMTDYSTYNPELAISNAAADLGYKQSSNVTAVVVKTYATGSTTGVTNAQNTAGYCVTVTSGSGKLFYYDSQAGGLTTAACT